MMSASLDESYGKTPIEQLTNIMFEEKEKISSKTYGIICELLSKVDKQVVNEGTEPHCLKYMITSTLLNATDAVKEDLDYCADMYNSDYENEHDWECEDDGLTINTYGYAKIYLNHKETWLPVLDFYSDFLAIIEKSFKNKKSYTNYQTSMNVAYEKHIKELHAKIKDNIDYEWTKTKDTHIKYLSCRPWGSPSSPLTV